MCVAWFTHERIQARYKEQLSKADAKADLLVCVCVCMCVCVLTTRGLHVLAHFTH